MCLAALALLLMYVHYTFISHPHASVFSGAYGRDLTCKLNTRRLNWCRTDSGCVVQLNITLMLFNLLVPAYPLDGGRILVDLLLLANVPAKVTAWITIVTAVAVSVAMIVVAVVWGYFGFGGILIALFILFSTFGLWQYLDKGQIEQHPLFRKASDQSENPAAEMLPKNDGPAAAHAQV